MKVMLPVVCECMCLNDGLNYSGSCDSISSPLALYVAGFPFHYDFRIVNGN